MDYIKYTTCPCCGIKYMEETILLRADSDNKTIYEKSESICTCSNCGFKYCIKYTKEYKKGENNKLECTLINEDRRIIRLGS